MSKGESEFKAGFVSELKIVGCLITAHVKASMKDKAYKISFIVDGNGAIREAECECPRGNGYVATWQLLQYMPKSMAFQRPICHMHR